MKNGLIIDKEGNRRYYLDDLLHRVDGPAEEWADGDKFWYLNGEKHRVDGPAIERGYGYKAWYLHGNRHRVDGPAIVYSNCGSVWYLHDKIHRVDGPATELKDDSKTWWLHGEQLIHPDEFETMEEWFEKLNTDEEYSLPWINDINGLIEFIKNPTAKQKRLHAIKWKL